MKPLKKVTCEVTNDCWKALKVLAVQKEVSLQVIVSDILERSMKKKIVSNSNSVTEVAEVE